MNFAHLHLILNHLPVVGLPVTLVFLIFGIIRKNDELQRFALTCLAVLSIVTVGVFLTGEPAEEAAENLPAVSEAVIEPHEEAATVSLVLTVLTGILALGTLLLVRDRARFRYAVLATAAFALVSTVSLGYTANLGGKVRHTEIR